MSRKNKKGNKNILRGNQRVEKFAARTENQQDYLDSIYDNFVTLVMGPAGTGKTFLAMVSACQAFQNGDFNKIVLTRPAVESCGEKLGALPGDATEKIDPYMVPLYESLGKILGKAQCEVMLTEGVIEVVPLAYMRGRTLDDAFVIMDEGQNSTPEQVKMLMTRLGKESKLVVTGDLEQSDVSNHYDNRKNRRRSGLEDAVLRFHDDNEDVGVVAMDENDIQRHPAIKRILRSYKGKLPDDMRIGEIFEEIFEEDDQI